MSVVPLDEDPTTARGLEVNDTLVSRATVGLLAGAVILGLGHAASLTFVYALDRPTVHGLVPMLDLGAEGSFGTWYSVMLLFATALVAWAVAARAASWRWNWRLVAVTLALMSIDETVGIHNAAGAPVSERLPGITYYAWIIPALIVAAAFLAVQAKFIRSLPPVTRWRLAVAAAVFLIGAAGLEYFEDLALGGSDRAEVYTTNLGSQIVSGFQEVGEMVGVILALRALALHLIAEPWELRIASRQPEKESAP